MLDKPANSVEIRVLRQIQDIISHISRLEEEKKGLESFLIKLRQEDNAYRDVNRRNSVNRVLFEEFVFDHIDKNKGAATSRSLYSSVVKSNGMLNPSTFRSSMRRMKEKEMIRKIGRGKWARPLMLAK